MLEYSEEPDVVAYGLHVVPYETLRDLLQKRSTIKER